MTDEKQMTAEEAVELLVEANKTNYALDVGDLCQYRDLIHTELRALREKVAKFEKVRSTSYVEGYPYMVSAGTVLLEKPIIYTPPPQVTEDPGAKLTMIDTQPKTPGMKIELRDTIISNASDMEYQQQPVDDEEGFVGE